MKKTALPYAISRRLELRESLTLGELERHVKRWLRSCEVDQHSETTLSFKRLVTSKLIWFLRREELPECSVDELRDFLAHITNGHLEPGGRFGNPRLKTKAKPSTVKTYHRDLQTLFNWLVQEGAVDISPMDRIPTPGHQDDQVQPFTLEQVDALLAAAKAGNYPKRNQAILLFMFDTGLRSSEVCSLKIGDIDLSGRELRVLGKGKKERSVHVAKATAKALFDHLKQDDQDPTDPLFAADDGAPLTRSGLYQLYARLGKAANISGVRCSPHTMRHTFAIEFLRGGGSEFALKTLLGHTDLKMTQRYVNFAKADIRNQHRQFSPLERWKSTKRQK